jgi:hypothetical protein
VVVDVTEPDTEGTWRGTGRGTTRGTRRGPRRGEVARETMRGKMWTVWAVWGGVTFRAVKREEAMDEDGRE